ncbi:MAG TPA: GHKL domain-containing protein [Ruminococcus sp.]|nr:GHKL domain-containing protein [Ruminococcus flavefaciens]HRU98249.1 GHKL domain-containing protein [Ruminococcus sp.]
MTIKNNISAPIRTKDSKLITSKPDKKNHGLGTMNVKECVAVNGGSVEYSYTDSDFTVDVVLPNVVEM